ncbi:MAG: S8 family serine peptidase [Candidatus Thiodiazotropha sp.]
MKTNLFDTCPHRVLLILGMTLCAHAAAVNPSFSTQNNPVAMTDRIIVKYTAATTDGSLPDSTASLVGELAGVDSNPLRQTFSGATVIQLSEPRPLAQIEALAESLNQVEGIAYAEADLRMLPLFTPDDPRFSEQWHYLEAAGGIDLPPAWDLAQGSETVVAVLDTGYLPHADLSANLLPGYDMISDEYVANDGDARDSDPLDTGDYDPSCGRYLSSWHGTHVSGTIAALTDNGLGVAGIAYRAKIVPVRVLGRCGGYLSDISDGIAWAAGVSLPDLPDNPHPAQVINLSLGSNSESCPQTVLEAIALARGLGASVVAAAGNETQDSAGIAPANCPGVITVAASDRAGALAEFSNFGETVDLAAPGEEILSTHNDGIVIANQDSYRLMSGTSMAAPHVSGVAALLYGMDPGITPDEVERRLVEHARDYVTPCSPCGSGILDAHNTLASMQPPESGLILLSDGVPETGLSAPSGESLLFAIDVPDDAVSLSIRSYAGSGDADLHVRYAAAPTTDTYDCRPYLYGNEENCVIRPVLPGRSFILLNAYADFADLSLVADYQLQNPPPEPDRFENLQSYPIPDASLDGALSPIRVERSNPAGQVRVTVTIRHSYIRELAVDLIDPSGTVHNLKGFGGWGTDLLETFILDLGDPPATGVWKLRARDLGNRGSGSIEAWRIRFD